MDKKELRKRIKACTQKDSWPSLEGARLIAELDDWMVYVSHDPCHDNDEGHMWDRNTVWFCDRQTGNFGILGRELPLSAATLLGTGEALR